MDKTIAHQRKTIAHQKKTIAHQRKTIAHQRKTITHQRKTIAHPEAYRKTSSSQEWNKIIPINTKMTTISRIMSKNMTMTSILLMTNKVDKSLPTESLEAILLIFTTDAKECCYVVVTDIPGAFLHVDMEQDVHMLLEGTIAKLITKLDPCLCRKFVWRN